MFTYHIEVGYRCGVLEDGGGAQLKLKVSQVSAVNQFTERYPRRPGQDFLEETAVAETGHVEEPDAAQRPSRTVEGGVGGGFHGVVRVVGVVEDHAAEEGHQHEE